MQKKKFAKYLKVIPQPSQFIERKLTALETEATEYIADKLRITKDEASTLLHSETGEWEKILRMKKRQFDVEMLELIGGFRDATILKLREGKLDQAKSGMTGIAIGSDKIYGEPGKPQLQIGGKNVQINLGWKFKPYVKSGER
jgi:hypothetical protein